jgi:hypothetical protein
MFEKHRHAIRDAIRDAHVKSHGILRGELRIAPGLPKHLAQGLFKEAKTYPVIIRLSTSSGAIEPDSKPAVKGFRPRIIGVEGKKFLPEQVDAVTQYFLIVNDTITPTGTVKTYHDTQLRLEKRLHGPEFVQTVVNEATVLADKALEAVGLQKEVPVVVQARPNRHLLGETYTTLGTRHYGD